MPNATITIPQPVLTSGQYFKTRYRLLPSGSWSSYVNRTNAPFTLTGLSVGQYQLEVILVKADGTNCAAVYKTFTIINDFDCSKISFTAAIVKTVTGFELQISYAKLAGYVNPPCNWVFKYMKNFVNYSYATTLVGTTGVVKITVPDSTGIAVEAYADMCNGQLKFCHWIDAGYTEPPCTNAVVTIPGTITYNGIDWFVTLNFINSTPATVTHNITYVQTSVMVPGNPPDTGSVTGPTGVGAGAAGSVTFKVQPKPFLGNLTYGGNFVDYCGKSHQWMAQG